MSGIGRDGMGAVFIKQYLSTGIGLAFSLHLAWYHGPVVKG